MSSDKIIQLNLEEVIEDYVWRMFKKGRGFLKRFFLRRSDYVFDIRWGYIDFKHVTIPDKKQQKSRQTASGQSTSEQDSGDNQASAIDAEVSNKVPTVSEEAGKTDIELYFSEYENQTSEPQKYTFKASRQTTATTKVELQETYTLGAKTNLEINFAEIVKFGAEVNASYSLTETKAEEFSRTLTWDIDTEIQVPKFHKAKASLYVYEVPSKSTFVVKTTLSLPSGPLPVIIRRAKDGREVKTRWILDLGILFKDYERSSTIKVVPQKIIMENGNEVMENQIVLTTRGVCRNVSFKNQHVLVECHKVTGAGASLADTSNNVNGNQTADEQKNANGGEQ